MNKWRTEERRSKKESLAVARENEKVQDMAVEVSYSILTSNTNLAKDAAKVSRSSISRVRKLYYYLIIITIFIKVGE